LPPSVAQNRQNLDEFIAALTAASVPGLSYRVFLEEGRATFLHLVNVQSELGSSHRVQFLAYDIGWFAARARRSRALRRKRYPARRGRVERRRYNQDLGWYALYAETCNFQQDRS
jgi:hypothetical protein